MSQPDSNGRGMPQWEYGAKKVLYEGKRVAVWNPCIARPAAVFRSFIELPEVQPSFR